MAKATSKKVTVKPRDGYDWSKWRNEIIGLCCLGIGLVLLFALLSYDSQDGTWHKATAKVGVSNWIGPFGANIASTMYQAFGFIALFVPLVFFALAYWYLRYERLQVAWLKVLGLAIIVLSLTGMLAIVDWSQDASFHWGGWIGHLLVYSDSFGLANALHRIGASIVLLLTFIVGVMMATSLSFFGLVMHLSPREQEAGVTAAVVERLKMWWQERQVERAEIVIGTQDERQKAKNEIRISQPETGNKKTEILAISNTEPAKRNALTEAISPAVSKARASVVAALSRDKGKSDKELAVMAQAPAPTKDLRAAPTKGNSLEEWDEESSGVVGKRSLEDMVSTASVKRPETLEEKAAAAKPIPVTSTLRTAIEYKLPLTEMLTPPSPRSEIADDELKELAIQLAEKCREFNVSGQVKQISPGPVVTTFEFKPDPGVKYSRITGLVDDLCLGLKAESIRIDRIPGKSTVGIEVPNPRRETIRLREVLESAKFTDSPSKLTLALGKTIDGSNYVADLARMPHLLIAGATGAGKSVALNSILLSLLYKATPDEVKLILVDPKRLELGLYADIPHLLTPIVTDPKRASYSLRWAVSEMENRYKHLAAFGVRNIEQYNTEVCSTIDRNISADSQEMPKPLPYIVIIIDELADLMMVAARDVEESITRLAQMARAVGIHLVLATQRPSVDVITGLIKANFPSRISFRVSSKVDSRTIIDANGAEGLLGQGDMLFLPPGTSRLIRVHGCYVDEKECKRVADQARDQGNPLYDEKIVMSEKENEGEELNGTELRRDEKYEEAIRIVIEMGRASTSVLQRRLRIGYGRAASIIDMMHHEGIVGAEDGSKPRQVLVKSDFLERLDQMQNEDEPW